MAIRTAADDERTRLLIHREIPQNHRTLGLDREPARVRKSGLLNAAFEALFQMSLVINKDENIQGKLQCMWA